MATKKKEEKRGMSPRKSQPLDRIPPALSNRIAKVKHPKRGSQSRAAPADVIPLVRPEPRRASGPPSFQGQRAGLRCLCVLYPQERRAWADEEGGYLFREKFLRGAAVLSLDAEARAFELFSSLNCLGGV